MKGDPEMYAYLTKKEAWFRYLVSGRAWWFLPATTLVACAFGAVLWRSITGDAYVGLSTVAGGEVPVSIWWHVTGAVFMAYFIGKQVYSGADAGYTAGVMLAFGGVLFLMSAATGVVLIFSPPLWAVGVIPGFCFEGLILWLLISDLSGGPDPDDGEPSDDSGGSFCVVHHIIPIEGVMW